MRFCPPKLYQRFLYWFAKNLFGITYKIVWRMRVTGAENIPAQGGVLIASNHLSLADPPLVSSLIPRPIYFFAKEELFRYPLFGWLIRQVNAFPVKRFEHDVGAFKRAQFLLENGQAVLVFPEGRRSKTGELGSARPGVGMLAFKARVPVVPVYVSNSHRLLRFAKLQARIGKPISPNFSESQKRSYQAFSDEVLAAIADLKSKL